jgi:hypothetical protein
VLDRRFAQPYVGGVEQNFVQRGADLGSREHGTQAVVCTAAAERHVWIVFACNVELEGIVKDVFVTIGRAKHRDDAGALLDRCITQHDVAASAANPEDDRRRPPQYFLHCAPTDVGIGAIPVGAAQQSASLAIISRSRSAPTAAAMSMECTTSANRTVTCLYSAGVVVVATAAPHSLQNLAVSFSFVPHDPHDSSEAVISHGPTRCRSPQHRVITDQTCLP